MPARTWPRCATALTRSDADGDHFVSTARRCGPRGTRCDALNQRAHRPGCPQAQVHQRVILPTDTPVWCAALRDICGMENKDFNEVSSPTTGAVENLSSRQRCGRCQRLTRHRAHHEVARVRRPIAPSMRYSGVHAAGTDQLVARDHDYQALRQSARSGWPRRPPARSTWLGYRCPSCRCRAVCGRRTIADRADRGLSTRRSAGPTAHEPMPLLKPAGIAVCRCFNRTIAEGQPEFRANHRPAGPGSPGLLCETDGNVPPPDRRAGHTSSLLPQVCLLAGARQVHHGAPGSSSPPVDGDLVDRDLALVRT